MTSRRRRAAARRRDKNQDTGSPPIGEPVFLLVGVVRRPHGVKGEVLMGVMTDFPERIKPGAVLYLREGEEPVTILTVRKHNKGLLLRFKEYPNREDVENLRNLNVFVRADDRPKLPKGEHYWHEMIGMAVVTDAGESLGVLVDLIETGANNVYVVRTEGGKEVLLPVINEVILKIDLKKKQMTVHLLEGLV